MLRNKQFLFPLILQSFILLACLTTCVVCKVSVLEGLTFFILQLFAIMIPGYAAFCLLCEQKKSEYAIYLYSGAFGYAVLLGEYLILGLLDMLHLSRIMCLLVLLVSVWIIFKKNDFSKQDDCSSVKDGTFILICSAIVYTVCLFSMSMVNSVFYLSEGITYNKDLYFWIGNSMAFTKGIPVQDFRQVGVIFYYHYFSSIIVAQMNLISGISIIDLSIDFAYIINTVLIVLSVFVLFEKRIHKKVFMYFGVLASLFTEGSTVLYAEHLYFNPFGFDYGFLFACLSIDILLETIETDSLDVKKILLMALFIALCTGFKGPVAIVILIGFGLYSFALLLNKRWKEGLFSGFAWLGAFLAVYLICISDISRNVSISNNLVFSGPLGSFDNNRWAIEILSELIGFGFPDNGITRILALFLFVLRSNTVAIVLLGVGLIYLFVEVLFKRKINLRMLCLTAISAWGILLTINTYQNGYSQMYFIMSVFPFSILSGLLVLDEWKVTINKTFIVVLILVLITGNDFYRFFHESFKGEIEAGLIRIRGEEKKADSGYYFSKEDYELAQWIVNNTSQEDYLVLDSFKEGEIRKEEGLGIFTGRFIWNDGMYSDEREAERRRNAVDDVFAGKENALDNLKQEGVDYLIQTKSIHTGPLAETLQAVYDSNTYLVYKIGH